MPRAFLAIVFTTCWSPAFSLISYSKAASHRNLFTKRESHEQDTMDWKPLVPLCLDVDPSMLAGPQDDATGTFSRKMAKDTEYAEAVQKAWREDLAQRSHGHTSEMKSLEYQDVGGTSFYGYVVRRHGPSSSTATKKVPGIVLFHTGAGPHDVFLQWKADSLATTSVLPDGCVVLIADILSDDSGWAWSSDRTKYNSARDQVLGPDSMGVRTTLQTRIQAALDAMQRIPEVDPNRLAAIGWCFGGHVILEIGRMQLPDVCAMATFHGVFDGIPPPATSYASTAKAKVPSKVLICNGSQDPFVSQSDLDTAIATLCQNGHDVQLQSYENARHGFSNPAQDFNPNPSFAYHDEAASRSWKLTLDLLESTLNKEL